MTTLNDLPTNERMKNSARYTIPTLVLAIVAIAGYYYYSTQAQTNILGRALVLGFVEDSHVSLKIASQWEDLDLSVELIDTCQKNNKARQAKCISKYIKKTLLRTQEVNKPLIVLADKGSSAALLRALNNHNVAELAALVLLQAEMNSDIVKTIDIAKTLIVSNANDPAENISSAMHLAASIRNNNQWVWSTMLLDDGNRLITHSVLPHMISFLINGKLNPLYQIEFDAESRWQQPIIDNQAFFQSDDLIETRDIDHDIQRVLKTFYAYDQNLLKQWPLKSYKAFNLLKYRDQLPLNKQGRFATFSNRKGHKFYLDMQRYAKYKPEFVVAIDHEENLYRLTSFYKTKRYYSWELGGPSNDMFYSQSLGAFIHFQNPPPADDELPYLQYSSILFESIEFTDQDPYAEITDLSPPAFRVLTMNCLPCHSVNSVGGAAHHLDYIKVKAQPGFAKPLMAYSKEVLENFFFNQTATAQLIGVNPNYVDPAIGKELISWLKPSE